MLLTACIAQISRADEPAVAGDQPAAAVPTDDDYALMQIFVDTFQEVDRNYVKDVDRRKLIEAAVRGMLSELDPYSNYIGPDDLNRFNEDVEQEFGGIGIQVQFDADAHQLKVLSPLSGSPAHEAGVLAGDTIVEIESQAVAEFPTNQELQTAVKMLKGPPGEAVTIGVRHPEATEVEQITITREIIQLDTVTGDHHNADGAWDYFIDPEEQIAYIRISHFSRRTTDELRDAMKAVKEQDLRGLVLDLRFNPGGLLTAAVEVSDMFIEKGEIVSTEGRNNPGQTWSAKRYGTYSGFPMAILVNRYSASASEIVSACLQDHKRAVIVGERTWGKGSVQNVIELEDGESALKLTTASYHRPSGQNIHRFPDSKEEDVWGVTPDEGFALRYDNEQMRGLMQSQRDREFIHADTEESEEPAFEDAQLNKALEYVRSQLAPVDTKPADDDPPPPAIPEKDEAAWAFPRIPNLPSAAA
ncbi:MAG: S41 family peptidase [Planctomycetaceae bacterium]|nr:S41 family peptidase [Planctomycetaceae bacterium]